MSFFRCKRLHSRPARAISVVLLTVTTTSAGFAQTLNSNVPASAPEPTSATTKSPLTLQAAMLAAQEYSAALRGHDAAAAAARDMAIAAGKLPDAMLRLSVDNFPVDGPKQFSFTQDLMTMRSLGLSRTLTRKDTRSARSASYERQADLAQASKAAQLAMLQRQTARAWFGRHFQQRTIDLLSERRDEAMLQVEHAQSGFRSGRGSQADIFLASSAVAKIDDEIRVARVHRANAVTNLRRWIGEAGSAPLAQAPDIKQTRLAAQSIVGKLDDHPEVTMMAAKEAMAAAQANVIRQENRPDWSVWMMFGQRGAAFSNMLSVGVSVPLQWDKKNRQERELAAGLARVDQAAAQREEIEREHRAQTQRWLDTWRSNLARLSEYDNTHIVLAGQRSSAALATYRGGKGSLSAVLEARRAEIDTRLQRLRIEMETAALWSELEFLLPANQQSMNHSEHRP